MQARSVPPLHAPSFPPSRVGNSPRDYLSVGPSSNPSQSPSDGRNGSLDISTISSNCDSLRVVSAAMCEVVIMVFAKAHIDVRARAIVKIYSQ